MDGSLLYKVMGVGLLVLVAHQVLSKGGRDEQAALVSIAGILTVLVLLLKEFSSLVTSIKGLFGL